MEDRRDARVVVSSPRPGARHWRRVLVGGLAAAAAAGLVGAGWTTWRLGWSTEQTVARVEREVRREVEARAAALRGVAARIARDPRLRAALVARDRDARILFDLVSGAADGSDASDLAVTIYDAQNTASAWSGRPSADVHERRLSGPPALLVAPSALGLRLVYVEPIAVTLAGSSRPHVGAIVAERGLSPPEWGRHGASSEFALKTPLASVSLTPGYVTTANAPPNAFVIRTASGEPLIRADLSRPDLARLRATTYRRIASIVLAVLGLTSLLLAGAWAADRRSVAPAAYRRLTLAALAAVVVARLLFWLAVPVQWGELTLFSPAVYASRWTGALHRAPIDLLMTAVHAVAVVALLVDVVRRVVLSRRVHREVPGSGGSTLLRFALWQVAGGALAAALLGGLALLLADTVDNTAVNLLDLSLTPDNAARVALVFALVFFQTAAVWGAVLALRLALSRWRVDRRRGLLRAVIPVLWLAPGLAACLAASWRGVDLPSAGVLVSLAFAAGAAWLSLGGIAWYRHGSQTLRLAALLGAILVPAWLLYPSLSHDVNRARRRLIETQYAVQALSHPEQLQVRLSASLRQIDAFPHLDDLLASLAERPGRPSTDEAFTVWRETDLARFRLTSSIELYAPPPQGALLSRFALNLPEYAGTVPPYGGRSCQWEVYGEGAPFGAEERRLLHADRAICTTDPSTGSPRIVGGIIVHVLFDYGTLPFLSPKSPYYQIFRSTAAPEAEDGPGRDVELVVYGWGRTPLYSSTGRAWPLPDEVFRRAYQSRTPFWTRIRRGAPPAYDVHVVNDRVAIFTLGYPVAGLLGHLVRLAELTTVAAAAYLVVLAAGVVLSWLWRESQPAHVLVREIRSSFSRKLFLAFVAAAVIPVLVLALLVRAFVATRLRADVEAEAARTATVAKRVIEEASAVQQPAAPDVLLTDDDLLGISRVIEQDVNVFEGASLVATSQRDLFASGLLPTRTPDSVYRAVVLQRLTNFVTEDQIGTLRYQLAAAPVRIGGREAVLTVPLASRQRQIEREIEELDRGVYLGVIVFILLGAALGYSMAQRIGDPVQRLTRASRRIAAGDLDARVVTRTADELQRLVEAFNSMAAELARQRVQLERTNRLEAWAAMARQVAHDIKNPLTPIQLAAEHLRHVHRDRGEPLGPLLDGCVDTILSQVRMLRQIAGEFASFAASPAARLAPTALGDVIAEVVSPYRVGLDHRVTLNIDVGADVPRLSLDRVLLGRAMTNVLENALHAMPGGGTLTVSARRDGGHVRVAFADTGVGMDEDALAHLFEPYFSTKASGTGLGLSIAKRNVELHGGTIEVASRKGEGTTVTLVLPTEGVTG